MGNNHWIVAVHGWCASAVGCLRGAGQIGALASGGSSTLVTLVTSVIVAACTVITLGILTLRSIISATKEAQATRIASAKESQQTRDQIASLSSAIQQLSTDKDKVHSDIVDLMKEQGARIRLMEEYFIRKGLGTHDGNLPESSARHQKPGT